MDNIVAKNVEKFAKMRKDSEEFQQVIEKFNVTLQKEIEINNARNNDLLTLKANADELGLIRTDVLR